jgi:hypothetical protein
MQRFDENGNFTNPIVISEHQEYLSDINVNYSVVSKKRIVMIADSFYKVF